MTGHGRWYSFDYGSAHFIAIDPCIPEELLGEQYDWLVADLEAATDGIEDPEFIFTFWHHPAYSSGAGSLDLPVQTLRNHIVPLMDTYRVDAIFCGHDHFYERNLRNGVYYIVAGGGGAGLSPIFPGTNPFSQVLVGTYQYCKVSISASSAYMEAIDPYGAVIDEFWID